MGCSSCIHTNKKTQSKNTKQIHVHTSHCSSWWLIQMEPWAANQIFAHMIYPAFLQDRVLRNIQTPLCRHVFAWVCLWSCSLFYFYKLEFTPTHTSNHQKANGTTEQGGEGPRRCLSALCLFVSVSLILSHLNSVSLSSLPFSAVLASCNCWTNIKQLF